MVDDRDIVIAEALWYLKKSQQILEEGLKDPTAWRIENEKQNKIISQTLPYLCLFSLAPSDPTIVNE